jgi:hypothetical protein
VKTPDAGARFGLSWSCAVAGRGVLLFLSRVFNRVSLWRGGPQKAMKTGCGEEMANHSLVGSRFFKGAESFQNRTDHASRQPGLRRPFQKLATVFRHSAP